MFTANLQNYSDEAKWLNQTENHCVFYLPGRGIVKDANEKYHFFPLGDISAFRLNEMIDGDLLADISILQDYEISQINRLVKLDDQLSSLKLHPVRIFKEKDIEYLIFSHERCEDTFYKIQLDELEKLKEIEEELLYYSEERDLENPYCIQINNDNSIFIY